MLRKALLFGFSALVMQITTGSLCAAIMTPSAEEFASMAPEETSQPADSEQAPELEDAPVQSDTGAGDAHVAGVGTAGLFAAVASMTVIPRDSFVSRVSVETCVSIPNPVLSGILRPPQF